MERITSPEVLQKEIDVQTKALEDKLTGKNGKRAICVCAGTGCLANYSKAILEEIESLLGAQARFDRIEKEAELIASGGNPQEHAARIAEACRGRTMNDV